MIERRTYKCHERRSLCRPVTFFFQGNEDNNNPPQCISDIVAVVQDGEKFILCRNEEQRLKNLANGSDEADYDSSSEDDSDGDNREDDDDRLVSKLACTGKLRPKGVPFSGFSYIKG